MELSLHGPPYIPGCGGGGGRVDVLVAAVVVENAATPTNPDVAVGSSNSSNCHPGTVAVASSSPTSILQCVIVALRCVALRCVALPFDRFHLVSDRFGGGEDYLLASLSSSPSSKVTSLAGDNFYFSKKKTSIMNNSSANYL